MRRLSRKRDAERNLLHGIADTEITLEFGHTVAEIEVVIIKIRMQAEFDAQSIDRMEFGLAVERCDGLTRLCGLQRESCGQYPLRCRVVYAGGVPIVMVVLSENAA